MSENNRRANSRLNRKKKANRILNILIGIVLLLIIVVVVNIVSDDTETTKEEKNTEVSEETMNDEETGSTVADENETESDQNNTTETVETEDKSESNEETQSEENEETNTEENTEENTEVITEASNDPNVESVIIDPSWKPIGTSQTGEHASSYDTKSVDWAEKVQALSYGAGLDPSNMYVKFLGNGGSPQKSIGTVTSKDGNEIYRISLEWIDGEGWKPTKKEILKSL
ncbi:hypothetical protein AM499_03015 [Bacillus sp. FJAT-22090]|uniref:YrrS family protein n=1 Tax=Bacillus sp. FJAT-22090 TaxID=1581038 RepID=UPI0006AFBD2C|nr:YrrS family protein [Bacillus sp. FJAT-22090]ALC84897.1 hypothetical protein AM499_03015 [Bacillus sp. FJAT-22090]